jgi:hypothetical protein
MPTFTDGYGAAVNTAKDTFVRSTAATYNFGATTSWNSSSMKMLALFDLSSIPAGSTINSATLSFFQTNGGAAGAFTITAYAIAAANAGWAEGTGNGSANAGAGEPCWDAKEADGSGGVTTAWAGSAGLSTSGTDYAASSIGSVAGNRSDANGTEYALSLDPTTVAAWCGTSNPGILLTISAAPGGIGSSDHATTGYRPKLVVEYTEAGGSFKAAWARGSARVIQ